MQRQPADRAEAACEDLDGSDASPTSTRRVRQKVDVPVAAGGATSSLAPAGGVESVPPYEPVSPRYSPTSPAAGSRDGDAGVDAASVTAARNESTESSREMETALYAALAVPPNEAPVDDDETRAPRRTSVRYDLNDSSEGEAEARDPVRARRDTPAPSSSASSSPTSSDSEEAADRRARATPIASSEGAGASRLARLLLQRRGNVWRCVLV